MEHRDVVVIGAGPAGAAAAIRAARAGASVRVFEKAAPGRDKVCGDGLTPRAVHALNELDIDMAGAHRIDGLRMIAGKTRRELPWPDNGRFAPNGAVWPRRHLDAHLMTAAAEAGAEVEWKTEATPILDGDRVVGIEAGGRRWSADLTVVATGAPGRVARLLGAVRVEDEPFGLAIRSYAESPRHDDRNPRGVPDAARRTRHPGTRLRLDVSGGRRHGQHRSRRPVDDEGLQEAQPQHLARHVSRPRPRRMGPGREPRTAPGLEAADERDSTTWARLGSRSAMPPDS